jgi:alkylation response protein AidB-like acyl-CoA dehydrogenase|tara:strand:- start:22460 stop:23677 length:1218 start_codon:yes stop_codon:yes gene_type:complete
LDFELKALTDPGKRMVELAEKHAADFAVTAAEYDRKGVFPVENVTALRKSGFAAAAVPEELGGMGVTSNHDCMVAMNRLGRAEGSTPLAFIMHLSRTLGTARALRRAIATGNKALRNRSEELLKKIGVGEAFITVANSEPGANIRTSRTLATKVEGGWLFNGAKTFATGSPAADMLAVRARFENEAGNQRMGAAIVPVDRLGVEIKSNWDGMGMRASGSHDVIFTDYLVKDEEFSDIGEYGKYNAPFLAMASVSSIGLSSIFLGIAESAHQIAVDAIKGRDGGAHYPMNQVTTADNEIDLAACRAMLSRAAQMLDDYSLEGDETEERAFQIIKNGAVAKKFVMTTSGAIVDRALTLYGGAGFLANSTLSRLYRDVRAGPFMQPWATNQAIAFIGQVALGLDPNEA